MILAHTPVEQLIEYSDEVVEKLVLLGTAFALWMTVAVILLAIVEKHGWGESPVAFAQRLSRRTTPDKSEASGNEWNS